MSAPNINELNWAISELEGQESSENRYILLSALYNCRDHMLGYTRQEPAIAAYAEAAAPAGERLSLYGDSDFLRAVDGLSAHDAWGVMDELMETLQSVNPRTYESVMRKLVRL